MITAIIPARGNSKGIPRKNLIPVGGKPLIAWSIEQAYASGCVDLVVVATDDNEIGIVAADAGATVVTRSVESCTDDAPSEMVLTEVLNGGYTDNEAIVFLQATSPFRNPRDIDGAVDVLRTEKADSVISVRVVQGYTWFYAGGQLMPRFFKRQPRQQQGGVLYEENGSIYVFKPHVLLNTGMRYGGRVAHYVMDPLDSFQIDEVEDLELFERILRTHDRVREPAEL